MTTVAERKAPQIAIISNSDIFGAMGLGMHDMQNAVLPSLTFGFIFAGVGWIILYLLFKRDWGSYAYPLATGFPLVAPIAAAGLYEISRRLEKGLPTTLMAALRGITGSRGKALAIMTVVSTFSYIIWIDIAAAIYVGFWGLKTIHFENLIEIMIMTPKGLIFMAIGNTIGAGLAHAVFSIMVVSMPVIFDRDVDFVTAMITSVKAVLKNPVPMLLWAAIIGFLLFLSLLSLFAGLIVVFPFLGHTSWHIYRKVVLREDQLI